MRFLSPVLLLYAALIYPVWAEGVPPLKPGDVIFQDLRSDQSQAIRLATGSRYTHVGIVDIGADGQPVVLEAMRTMRATPLADWLRQGEDGAFAVYRYADLTNEQARQIAKAARSHLGTPYDPYFHASEDQLYCSELVYIAFRDGIGVKLGQMQKLGELNLDNAAVQALVGERWQRHPACKDGQARDAQSCLARILKDPLITPQALSEDDRLTRLYSSFPD